MKPYFEGLNYSLGNEDTQVESWLLQKSHRSVVSVCGSGSRVLPLIAANPETLDIIDIAPAQLFLCELRIAAAKQLDYEEFLYFLGYRGAIPHVTDLNLNRMQIFKKLELSNECRQFWLAHSEHWASHGWIFLGKWERHFLKLGIALRNWIRLDASPLFEAHSVGEQLELYRTHWRPTLFRSFLRIAASDFVFNRYLYQGHFSGQKNRRTVKKPGWQHINDEFDRIFKTTLLRKNFFMQFLMLGSIRYEEGLPMEAWRTTHLALKNSKTRIRFLQQDMLSALAAQPYDFYSLSDVVSYLGDAESLQLFEKVHRSVQRDARAVVRGFLRMPAIKATSGWNLNASISEEAQLRDGTAIYQFKIFDHV